VGRERRGILGETYDAVEGVEHIESVFFGLLEGICWREGLGGERGGGGEVKRLAQQYIPLYWDHIAYIRGPKSETLLLQ
jgi:hypothetical protein